MRAYTVVRVKSAVTAPGPGCLTWVLATDGDGHSVEWQTAEPFAVGDPVACEVRRLPRPMVGDVAS